MVSVVAGVAQVQGPALSVDAGAGRHAISPDVYGINYYWDLGSGAPSTATLEAAADIRATARRWGGNNTSTYHWQFDVWNLDNDWYFEVLPGNPEFGLPAVTDPSALPAGSLFNRFADRTRTTGGKLMVTAPVLGWLPKARQEMASFSVAKYGQQCAQDPYSAYHAGFSQGAGNGVVYSATCSSNPVYVVNDPHDTYAESDESFQAAWASYLITRYGKGAQGGATIWELDNEPIWWNSTHRDIHPKPFTYDELWDTNLRYAAALKQADPTALIAGPVNDNWASLWFSMADIQAGWNHNGNYWGNPVDRNAHGGTPLLAWYLQQFKKDEQTRGKRLLDYVDMHAYLAPDAIGGTSGTESAAVQALRLDSTRVFWDPTYIVSGNGWNNSWIKDVENNGTPIAPSYIPRVRAIIDQNYPGTKFAITEYDWARQDTLNGGLAQADLLGIFGREGLDAATLWPQLKPTSPGAFAFKIYRNYDGMGGTFGETGVQAASEDQGKLAVYAAVRSDLNLTLMAINKTGDDLSSLVSLANFSPGTVAKVWRYSAAQLDAIVAQPDLAVSGAGFGTVFPANSITLLVIPPATLPVERPVVTAVTSAASYDSAIAPGQMVVVWGSHLGPDSAAPLRVDPNGMVSTSTGGVRVLFDGVPAPMVYALASQCSAVVPYFGATKATTHVQVEYQGVRSLPVEFPVGATAPGLFTMDFSGKGRGAILNEDGVTVNSPSAPAHPGSVVVLWGTGEGVTDPPGVDGRPAVDVLPKPVAPVSVQIGGLPAVIDYAGAAPGTMPGLFQINARIPAGVSAGDSVPVSVKVGTLSSQQGVTVAVR
jgi:uncharacterized protein (TIGR03437 family)